MKKYKQKLLASQWEISATAATKWIVFPAATKIRILLQEHKTLRWIPHIERQLATGNWQWRQLKDEIWRMLGCRAKEVGWANADGAVQQARIDDFDNNNNNYNEKWTQPTGNSQQPTGNRQRPGSAQSGDDAENYKRLPAAGLRISISGQKTEPSRRNFVIA